MFKLYANKKRIFLKYNGCFYSQYKNILPCFNTIQEYKNAINRKKKYTDFTKNIQLLNQMQQVPVAH